MISPQLNYAAHNGTVEWGLTVRWGNNFLLESTQPLVATVYKCGVLADNECSLCVNLEYTRPQLNCDWCESKISGVTNCHYKSQCLLTDVATCPAPRIDKVWPLSGPVNGGTRVTIEGSNLGAKFEDIENAVTVSKVGCIPFRELYLPSKRIVCELKWRGQLDQGPIIVSLGTEASRYHTNFEFRSPSVSHISPTDGPRSGGTRVTIYGVHMDTGAVQTATFGDAPCIIDKSKIRNTSIECITTSVWHAEAQGPIRVEFDGTSKTVQKFFAYREDPTVTGIGPLKSILEGGRNLTVRGTSFQFIQEPKMFAWVPTITGEYYPTNTTVSI